MNFLSKLIIFVILVITGTVLFLSFKMIDLKNEHMLLDNKIEKINKDLKKRLHLMSKSTSEVTKVPEKMHYGIDVSHWNGDIISEIPGNDHISFVICKATQGVSYIDVDFKDNWLKIKETNKIRGAYHFYLYNDDPIKQANHFCNVVNDLDKKDISLILDIEELSLPKEGIDKIKLNNDLLIFLEHVENKINRTPIIYTDFSFANEYLYDDKFAKYSLWLAEYSNAKEPKIPNTWKDKGIKIWQKRENYDINSSKVDYDVFFGEIEKIIL
jgi:lysozyme